MLLLIGIAVAVYLFIRHMCGKYEQPTFEQRMYDDTNHATRECYEMDTEMMATMKEMMRAAGLYTGSTRNHQSDD